MGYPPALEQWHRILRDGDFEALDDLLADDVVFHSPVVHTPQEGKPITKLYLSAAFGVFGGDGGSLASAAAKDDGKGFRYLREIVSDTDAALEFRTTMDGIVVNGVDLIRWNDEGRIVDFKVMIRPLKAIQKVHGMMASMLERLKSS